MRRAVEKTRRISYSWLHGRMKGLPFAIDSLSRDTVVVYFANGRPSRAAGFRNRDRGDGTVLDGYTVFLTQVQQFQMMVGKAMPATTGREIAVSGGFYVHQHPIAGRTTTRARGRECSS